MIDFLDKKYFKLAVGENIGRETDVDISAKCPICGDSKIHRNEKRLHIYEKNGITLVHCFNGDCSVTPQSVGKFLKFFYPDLYSSYKREKNLYNINSFKNYISESNTESEDIFKKIKEKKEAEFNDSINNIELVTLATFDYSNYFDNIINNNNAINYLKSRGFNLDDLHGLGDFYYSNINMNIGDKFYKLKDCLIIPLYIPHVANGKIDKYQMYGFYSRSINSKEFYTFMPEENQGYKIWNWFRINKNEPVYIFEGIFDALSAYKSGIKNVIACMGATIPQERINELKHPVFCLDNDKTGLKNALIYSKKYNVLVLPENIHLKDMNEIMKSGTNVKTLILNNIYNGLLAEVKIRKKL